ncbi:Elongator complex protein 5 [Camelus dromedarius]|uniref:Elongator complex protein 5 n=1 Tax=Camelus dromedarius TaxID=9838 RepID=A0A5N4D1M1_CAMDR|nr:Elongator complex protein 5 [Camelus dromedarius]
MTPSEGVGRGMESVLEMLESLLALGGMVLLRDTVEWEGRSLLKALIKKSALYGEQVHVLGCEVSEEEFREGFDSNINSRWLLLHLPCTTLCQALHALSRQDPCPGLHPEYVMLPSMHYISCPSPGKQVRVLGLLHEELHGPGPVRALSSLAQAEVTLSGALGQASAHILYRRPRQHPTHQTQRFSILPDFSLDLQGGPLLEPQPQPDPHTPPVDPTNHLTFNLRLSKKEREAKDSLTLPFQFSSEKQQALLRPGPGQATSHIFYEPDAYDDLDQEDPDDDLDI